jgi:hypothetical protein
MGRRGDVERLTVRMPALLNRNMSYLRCSNFAVRPLFGVDSESGVFI